MSLFASTKYSLFKRSGQITTLVWDTIFWSCSFREPHAGPKRGSLGRRRPETQAQDVLSKAAAIFDTSSFASPRFKLELPVPEKNAKAGSRFTAATALFDNLPSASPDNYAQGSKITDSDSRHRAAMHPGGTTGNGSSQTHSSRGPPYMPKGVRSKAPWQTHKTSPPAADKKSTKVLNSGQTAASRPGALDGGEPQVDPVDKATLPSGIFNIGVKRSEPGKPRGKFSMVEPLLEIGTTARVQGVCHHLDLTLRISFWTQQIANFQLYNVERHAMLVYAFHQRGLAPKLN